MSRKRNNIPGAAEQPLRTVKNQVKPGQYVISSKSKDVQAYNDIVKAVVAEIRAAQADSGNYSRQTLSKSIDNILDRVVFELDKREQSAKFTDDQVAQIKSQIQESLSESNLSGDAISEIKNDISDIAGAVKPKSDGEQASSSEKEEKIFAKKTVEKLDDEIVGDYQDSTVASDFDILQKFIDEQFKILNESIKNIPGSAFGGVTKIFSAGIGKIWGGISSLGKKVTGFAKNTVSRISGFAKSIAGGTIGKIGKAISGLGKGIGSVMKGIGGLGSKLKTGIAGAFGGMGSKIGGFFSKLNPFKKSPKKDKAAAKKEALREKMLNFLTKIMDKLWKLIEPFIKYVTRAIMKFIIIPIMTIAIKIGLIIAGITLLVVGAVLAYKWIKEKISDFVDYIFSGELWDDCVEALTKAWEWIKDFGKWLWDTIIKALKFIFVDIWVELGIWIWEKLVEFGTWLYDEFIYPWIVQPIQILRDKLVKFLEPIMAKLQPFIESFNNLKDRLVSIWKKFKWDENKSFFENLKCLASIVKDAVLDWWNDSPFKVFYEQHLEPIVNSVKNLIERVKTIWSNFKWDESASFVENLGSLAGVLIQGIKDWWNDPDNPIRAIWDKVVAWFKDMTKPIVDWYNNSELKKWVDKIVDFGKAIKDAIVTWWESSDNPIKAMIDKLANMIWSLPVIGTFRPFGFLAGKEFFLSEAEEKEYKEITSKREEAQDLQKEIDKLQKYIDTKDYKGGDGKASFGRTKEEMERDIAAIRDKQAKLNAEANAAAAEQMRKNQEVAAQQVAPAMRQLNGMEQARAQANGELSREAQLYTKEAAEEKQQQDALQQEQGQKMDQILLAVNNLNVNGQTQPDDIAAAAAAGGAAGGAAGASGKRRSMILENR